MRVLFAIFILIFSAASFAQQSRLKIVPAEPPSLLKAYLLGVEARFEKTADLDWADRRPLNIAFGFQKKQLDFLMEYASFNVNTGNASLSVDREHQEIVGWVRWHAYEHKWIKNRLSFYGGAGVGSYLEKVSTQDSLGNSYTADSDYKIMSALSLGIEMQMPLSENFGVLGAMEGRALMASDFEPNPTGSGVLRIGFFINL